MLTSIVLKLTTDRNTTLKYYQGRANYAITLRLLEKIDGTLARDLHDAHGPKPLTCSSLVGIRANGQGLPIQADQPCYVRITGLNEIVSQALLAVLIEEPPQEWALNECTFQVQSAVCDPEIESWSGMTTYEELAAFQLLSSERLPRRVSILFDSPTSFQSKGMHIPVPTPDLFFGSLVDRWNTFSPVTLSPEIRRFGDEMVAISNYRLQSQFVPQKKGTPIIGGVGRCTYTALSSDRYWLGTMQMLADFALYSGVGVKTTVGMGQCRRVDS